MIKGMIRIAYKVLETLVHHELPGDNFHRFIAREVVQRSGKGPGWAPAVAQPLCVSLSPALSQELCVGAEAPGVPSSEPHCRCEHLLPGDTFLRCCSSCGPLSSLMDNWGTVPQLQSRSPAEFPSSRCTHLKASDIFFSFFNAGNQMSPSRHGDTSLCQREA